MSDSCIEEIENHGFYTLFLNGHLFFLEVIPQTEETRNAYLKKLCKEHSIGGGIYTYAKEVIYINEIDFTLSTFITQNTNNPSKTQIHPNWSGYTIYLRHILTQIDTIIPHWV